MPCDSITTQSISQALSKGMPALVEAALRAAGFTILGNDAASIRAARRGERVAWAAGKGLVVSSASQDRNAEIAAEITRGYAKAAVSWAASRAGFTVKAGGDKLTLTRR